MTLLSFREISWKGEILSDEGETADCFCGCGFQIFLIPLKDFTRCSFCSLEINLNHKATKIIYKNKIVAHFHNRCEPETIREAFPLPS